MTALTPDPLEAGGIGGFGERLRQRQITAEAATTAYLARIEALDPRLSAFQHVAPDRALAAARAVDALLSAGVDLGPLMGVPVAVKDLLAVDGMPTTAGSRLDVGDLIGPEGGFVRALKRAGCVILGKTRTVEFALGATGLNSVRGTPWNPHDSRTHTTPGGSSSGSAVAVAAGLCAFAIGTDTGGSVRTPAAFCGVTGFKPTVGLWPTDGVFPLSPTLDSIGPLAGSAADAALVFAALTGAPVPEPAPPRSLRLGRPVNHFFDDLDPAVEAGMAAALAALDEAGIEVVEVEVPEVAETATEFRPFIVTELIAVLGRERFLAGRAEIDPLVAAQAATGLEISAETYLRLARRRVALGRLARDRMRGFDGWVMPTTPALALSVAEAGEDKNARLLARRLGRNTRVANLFDLCAVSVPVRSPSSSLPAGLQFMCAGGDDGVALSVARIAEKLVEAPPPPELAGFLGPP